MSIMNSGLAALCAGDVAQDAAWKKSLTSLPFIFGPVILIGGAVWFLTRRKP